ncbi:MAG: FkbM family methyltransferase [Candidatus Methylacidiphilales bacterium]
MLSLFIKKQDPVEITTVDDGLKLSLKSYSDSTRIYWWFEEVEASLQFFIRRFLPVGGNMLDVGSASGIIGLLAARLKGAQVKLVEANPVLIDLLTETLKLNPKLAPLCQLIGQPCALSGSDERFKDSPGITIERIIQDSGWNRVHLLKVDVDGPDFDVLRSAGSYLRPDFIEAIFIETEVARPEDIISIAKLGYVPYTSKRTHLPNLRRLWINQTERTHYQPLDLDALTEKNVPANVLYVDEKGPLHQHLSRWCS